MLNMKNYIHVDKFYSCFSFEIGLQNAEEIDYNQGVYKNSTFLSHLEKVKDVTKEILC